MVFEWINELMLTFIQYNIYHIVMSCKSSLQKNIKWNSYVSGLKHQKVLKSYIFSQYNEETEEI